jgi:hypothetical protein
MTDRQRALWGLFVLFGALILTLQPSRPAQAQEGDGSAICEAISSETLTQIGVACTDVPTGSVCYGARSVSGEFSPSVLDSEFAAPGDTISIDDISTISAEPLDSDAETWGATVFSLQANLPTGYPESVRMVAFGGVEIVSAVDEDALFVPLDEPIAGETNAITDLIAATLSEPRESAILELIPGGTPVLADAISEDGAYVRVIVNERAGWISAEALDGIDLDALPVYSTASRTPLQAFYFRSLDEAACASATPSVLIQGPEGTPIDLIINDVVVRIESTVVLRTQFDPDTNQFVMEVIVLFGLVRLNPDSLDEVIIPAGFTLTAVFDGIPGEDGVVTPSDEPLSIIFGELAALDEETLATLTFLDDLPDNFLLYVFEPPVVIQPSGVGGVVEQVRFGNPDASSAAGNLCATGSLPADVCEILGF